VPQSQINLTLVLFFVCFSAASLFWGPMSDRYGRRPVLLAGLAIYTLASALCAAAPGVWWLVVWRVLQAAGGAAGAAVATAMVKDLYSGRRRESVLALVQSLVMLAPIVAPVPGALLLKVTSWRGIFWVFAAVGALALLMGLAVRETCPERQERTVPQTLARLAVVLRNPGFAWLLATFSLVAMPVLAYVASSTHIYQTGFGLDKVIYSCFFAVNAAFAAVAPILYLWLSRHARRTPIITVCLATVAASGVAICLVGSMSPWLFAAAIMPATLTAGVIRPPAANLMLEQQKEDTGSAASLMGCCGILMGSLGMLTISIEWGNTVLALGVLYVTVGLACTGLWLYSSRQPFVTRVAERHEEAVREVQAEAAEEGMPVA